MPEFWCTGLPLSRPRYFCVLSQFTGLDVICPDQVAPARLLTLMVSLTYLIPASPVSMAQYADTKVHET